MSHRLWILQCPHYGTKLNPLARVMWNPVCHLTLSHTIGYRPTLRTYVTIQWTRISRGNGGFRWTAVEDTKSNQPWETHQSRVFGIIRTSYAGHEDY